MSFMFDPTDYSDPSAVNVMDASGLDMSGARFGNLQAAMEILNCDAQVIGIDGYTTASFVVMTNMLQQAAHQKGIPLAVISTDTFWRGEKELDGALKAKYLPDDIEKDPVLLYGKLFDGSYEDLMRPDVIRSTEKRIEDHRKTAAGKLVLLGHGALCETFARLCDRRVWMDVIPLRAILNVKEGKYRNIGLSQCMTFKQTARRCYFVDFELAMRSRERLLAHKQIHLYVAASKPESMYLLPMDLVEDIFSRGLESPFRCRPVYLRGVWGGYYVKKLRHLPDTMENCAWVFDLIPMEVSLAYLIDGTEVEFPFYTLVQTKGDELMGRESVAHFGRYFPIRFNYDDTYHSNGNMSIQCHPTREYIRSENGEFDRQDESYYVITADQGACTYLGFQEEADTDRFFVDVENSAKNQQPIDYRKYVHAVESKPGVQVMIPAGTIHASGRNQVVLEIGSLTVGSYTYKMYDYCRRDLDGNARPLHICHAKNVLCRNRTSSWVENNVVNRPKVIRSGADWQELIVGEHPLLYFTLHNVHFITGYEDDTKGRFHVLSLVNGEKVMVRSKRNPERYFIQNYLDIIIIPASMGEYEVINLVAGSTATLHKTLLKDGFEGYPEGGDDTDAVCG